MNFIKPKTTVFGHNFQKTVALLLIQQTHISVSLIIHHGVIREVRIQIAAVEPVHLFQHVADMIRTDESADRWVEVKIDQLRMQII